MIFLVFLGFLALSTAAPQYQPFAYKRVSTESSINRDNDGQYHPDNTGAYNPDSSGGYLHSDNPYIGSLGRRYPAGIDNSGQYVPDNSGAYNNNDGQYHPDNSGAYNPDALGQYVHSGDSYIHQGGNYNGDDRRGFQASPVSANKPTLTRPVAASSSNGNKPVANNNNYKNFDKYGIIRKIEQVLEDGYHYIYETENGILAEEEGHLANKGQENEYMDVKGFYKYIGKDNVEYKVEYTVDALNGFVPKGDHLPQIPQATA
ncbi:uncharacterized protein [Leptinotarsa decemlineata]|uniref:uncharacterized protein n=1 Tax=Leptinotarsa decemlineata TaxID=7539 RepID=UPI003D307C52